MKYLRSLSIRS